MHHNNVSQPILAAALWEQYMQRLQHGTVSQLFNLGPELEGLEVGPGLVTVIGGPPGGGKTAIASKIAFDAMKLDQNLSVCIANAESNFEVLAQRELLRRTGIASRRLRFGQLTAEELGTCQRAASEISPFLHRIGIMVAPFSIANLLYMENYRPGLLIVDYLQQFSPSNLDGRLGVNAVMAALRDIARAGWAVLCLSATKRDSSGKHSAKALDLSSFRESGEIEYNADSAYVLVDKGPSGAPHTMHVELRNVKNRHGELKSYELDFNQAKMEFSPHNPAIRSALNPFAEGRRA